MPADRRRLLLTGASVFVVAALVFLNSLGNGFALDDVGIIQENRQVHGVERLDEALTGPYWPGGAAERGLYRPFTLATYAVNWELGDGQPFGFHLVNVLLHAGVSILVMAVLLSLGVGLPGAWAGALVFAVHPVHVEAVANVVGRAEVLAALFFLGACLAYVRQAPVRGWGTAALVGVLYFLGLTSKENAVVLPGVLALYHLYAERRVRPAARAALGSWRAYAALVLALIAYFVMRKVNIGVFLGAESPPWYYGMAESARILTAIRVWPEYLRLMLVPLDLVPDYGPGVIVPETTLLSPLVILGLLTAVATALVAWRARRALPLLAAGITFFVLTALPVMGILFPVGIILAERTLYLPSVGLAMGVAACAGWAWTRTQATAHQRRLRGFAVVALLVVVAAGALRTWTANPVWQSSTTVMNRLLAKHNANYRGQWALAASLREVGDTVAALEHLELATRMVPGYSNLRVDYGQLLAEAGEYHRAAAQLDTALAILPQARRARVLLMETHLRYGNPAAAVRRGLEATRWHADEPLVQGLLARALGRVGRLDEAVAARSRSIQLQDGPATWAEWGHLAGLATLAGDTALATRALHEARAVAPEGLQIPTPPELSAMIESRGPPIAIPLW